MKILSKTEGGGRVVELTHQEWVEFAELSLSIEGKEENEAHWNFQIRDYNTVRDEVDFSGVFGAILAFKSAMFRVNELQKLTDNIRESLIASGAVSAGVIDKRKI